VVPTTTVFLDFGFNFPAGGLLVTNALMSGVNGPTVFDAGGNTLIPLTTTIQNQGIDLNGDGLANLADATIFANGVVQAVQRTFEPYDVIVTQAAANTFTDIANTVGANGTGLGNRDAYVIVAGDDPTSNPAWGWAPVDAGNGSDNTSFAFADEMIRWGAAMLGVGLVAGHEAAHTFGLGHTNGSVITGIGDVMGVPITGQPDLRNFFVQNITSRFDLGLESGAGTQNNYDILADPSVVGLRAGAAAYVTGTGAHDRITITPGGAGQANVLVEAFSAAAMNPGDLIATASYTVNTANGILVEAGANDDLINYDVNVGANLEVRGGHGRDTLRVQNGTPSYTPAAPGDDSRGSLSVGGLVVTFSETEFVWPVAPRITSLVPSLTAVNENGIVNVRGAFLDPGSLSSHTVRIEWGDGSVDEFGLFPGARNFVRPHRYRDDGSSPGNNTPQDDYAIKVTITDNDNLQGSSEAVVTVSNLAPVITSSTNNSPSSDMAAEGEAVTVSGMFTDIGTLDRHAVAINWGDGTVTAGTVTQGVGTGAFTGSHAYGAGGIYTITVTLMDDDTGIDTAVETVFVTGAGIQEVNGQTILFVVGTNESDYVTMNSIGRDTIQVHAKFLPGGKRSFGAAGVDLISAYLGGGDDLTSVAGNVLIPAILDGGDGADHLNAGEAGSVLIGGFGDDMLVGSRGRDILIGGDGRDRLVGNGGEDILIGGLTAFDSAADNDKLANDAAVLSILAEWGSDRGLQSRMDNITGNVNPEFTERLNGSNFLKLGDTVTDDGFEDVLTGSAGDDWLFA
jgi:hypothetical protein